MIRFNDKYRSMQAELMDDLQFKGAEMEQLLSDLKRVNKWLGGNSVTLEGIKKLLSGRSWDTPLRILDVGCGDGAMLRYCADWFRQNNIPCQLTGIDANPYIVEIACKRSRAYSNIEYFHINVFSEEIEQLHCDIALFTLFLHHFSDEEIIRILKNSLNKAKVGIVVNDLERSRIAYYLFGLFSYFFIRTRTARQDGLLSICRAFKKRELQQLSNNLIGRHSLKQAWAFRLQWLIETT